MMPVVARASSRSWRPCTLVDEERVDRLNIVPRSYSILIISLVSVFLFTASPASSSRTSSPRVSPVPNESYVTGAPNASPHLLVHSVAPRMVNLIYGAFSVRCAVHVNLSIPLPELSASSPNWVNTPRVVCRVLVQAHLQLRACPGSGLDRAGG